MQEIQITDPVSGFSYPASWIKAGIGKEEILALQKGLSVLTADGTILKRGFTTGTTAAAAAKAAVLSLRTPVTSVDIMTPAGIRVDVLATGREGHGVCQKYSGDYPDDVTAGISIQAIATRTDQGVEIRNGLGVGIWERDNPRYAKGTPAISPPAYEEILTAISEAVSEIGIPGVQVYISVRDGEKIAEKTLNAKIGVGRGISILGSTGFVEPWDDHIEETLIGRVQRGMKVVLTTGRIGLKFSRLLFPDHETILVGSRIGAVLSQTRGEVIICGLPALILKFMNPDFLVDSGYGSVEEMIGSELFYQRATATISSFCCLHPQVRIVLLDRTGGILMESA